MKVRNGINRIPIEQLSIDFNIPLNLANCLVGRTETETERRIAMFTNYLGDVLKNKRMWERFDFLKKDSLECL